MTIEEITDAEIEELVLDVGWCIRKRLRRFAADKKEKQLLSLLNSANLSEEARLRTYLDQTDYQPAEVDGGITIYERPCDYLVGNLFLTPAKATELLDKLAAEHRLVTKEVDGRLIVVFPQPTVAKPK